MQPMYNTHGAFANAPFGALGSLPHLSTVLQPVSLFEHRFSSQAMHAELVASQLQGLQQSQAQPFISQYPRRYSSGGQPLVNQDSRQGYGYDDVGTEVQEKTRGKSPLDLNGLVIVPQIQTNRGLREQQDEPLRDADPGDWQRFSPQQSTGHETYSLTSDFALHAPQPRSNSHPLSGQLEQHADESNTGTSVPRSLGPYDTEKSAPSGLAESLWADDSSNHRSHNCTNGAILPSSLGPGRDYRAEEKDQIKSFQAKSSPALHNGTSGMSSGSGLNVEAKEFKFDPSRVFLPNNLSAGAPYFQAGNATRSVSDPLRQAFRLHRQNSRLSGDVATKLNVKAPAFEPRAINNPPLPTTDFSFSSTVASSRPVLPTPSSSEVAVNKVMVPGAQASSIPLYGSKSQIFDLDHMVVSERNPNAVYIPRTEAAIQDGPGSYDHGEQEDESGRITQAPGRHKKMRRSGTSGDEVPQFLTPLHPEPDTERLPVTEAGVSSRGNITLDGTVEEDPLPELKKSPEDSTATGLSIPGTDKSYHEHPQLGKGDGEINGTEGEVAAQDFSSARPSLFAVKENTNARNKVVESPAVSPPRHSIPITNLQEFARPEPATATVTENGGDYAISQSQNAVAKSFSSLHGSNISEQDADALLRAAPLQEDSDGSAELVSSIDNPVNGSTDNSLTGHGNPATMKGSFEDALTHPLRSVLVNGNSGYGGLTSPTLDQLGATAQQYDESDPDERFETPQNYPPHEPASSVIRSRLEEKRYARHLSLGTLSRCDAPSPSPGRRQRGACTLPNGHRKSNSSPPNHDMITAPIMSLQEESVLLHVNSPGDVPASDLDNYLSTTEDLKYHTQSQFFDGQVGRLLRRVLDQRLGPLEKSLETIQDMVTVDGHRSRNSSSRKPLGLVNGKVDSDADDEDDSREVPPQQTKSPRRDRDLNLVKAAVLEGIKAHQGAAEAFLSAPELSDIRQILSEVKSSSKNPIAHDHARGDEAKIAALERSLGRAEQRAGEELQNRVAAERKVVELEKRLGIAEAETARQRSLAEERDRQLETANSNSQQSLLQAQKQVELLESARDDLRQTISEVSATNGLLVSDLREARVVTECKSHIDPDLRKEDQELIKAVGILKVQLEESVRIRESLHGKFERLQDDLTVASRRIEMEKASWRKKERDHIEAQEVLMSRLQAETDARQHLEREVYALQSDQPGVLVARANSEQLQSDIAKLETMVEGYRLKVVDSERLLATYQDRVDEAREAGREEVQRVGVLMESQLEVANNQVNVVRAELENELRQARTEAEHYKLRYEQSQATGRIQLGDAVAGQEQALKTAADASEVSLQEQHHKYERHLDDLKFQYDLKLQNSVDDKQRTEAHLLDRLSLSNAKTEHLQERVSHLEEKLELARAAANAAAQAAQQAKTSPVAGGRSALSSVQLGDTSSGPLKLSPQALRESIFVLQDQLQEREMRIEKLEQEISSFDREAPAKVKEQQAEIGWLRELLGVRITDLEDIINSLSADAYDRDAVKDAAIRLKANLEMQQQEREKAMVGGRQTFPSLASISSFASPKVVLPLAAAWGNWRKSKEASFDDLHRDGSVDSDTPSKSTISAQQFFTGLLTPPSANQRQGRVQERGERGGQTLGGDNSNGSRSLPAKVHRGRSRTPPLLPSTPTLLLSQSLYDQDAPRVAGPGEDDDSTRDYSSERMSVDEVFGIGASSVTIR